MMTVRVKDGWLHYVSVEGRNRALRCDSIVAVVEDPWTTPDGKVWPCTNLRSRTGQLYRVPEEYYRVLRLLHTEEGG